MSGQYDVVHRRTAVSSNNKEEIQKIVFELFQQNPSTLRALVQIENDPKIQELQYEISQLRQETNTLTKTVNRLENSNVAVIQKLADKRLGNSDTNHMVHHSAPAGGRYDPKHWNSSNGLPWDSNQY